MVSYYDEIEIEDFSWDPVAKVYHTPCPCGDRFEISRSQLAKGDEIATCPSCSLIIRVVYDFLDFEEYLDDESSQGDSVENGSNSVEEALAELKI